VIETNLHNQAGLRMFLGKKSIQSYKKTLLERMLCPNISLQLFNSAIKGHFISLPPRHPTLY